MMAEIRKLETWQEWVEADHLIATAFLHGWDQKKSEEQFQAEASGEKEREDTSWGLFDDAGKMMSAIVTSPKKLMFEGEAIHCDELHMVGSLPENRGAGSIRSMMEIVLRHFKEQGDPFAILIPFSFAFYRKFGFELAQYELSQKAQIGQFASFSCDYRIRQVSSQVDADQVRALHEAFTRWKNLAEVKEDKDWVYKGNGEFGERDWWFGDKQQYTYLFQDDTGKDRAYLTFVFNHGPQGPFIGSMEVLDAAFDSPEALRNLFGFIYGMRAKITDVKFTFPRELDLALLLPECDDVERKLGGHLMGRVLNIEKVLMMLRHPAGQGTYRIHIDDKFLAENTGTYEVSFVDGHAESVRKVQAEADLVVTVETFLQLAIGLADLDAALFREGSRLNSNGELLRSVFVKKQI